MIALLKLIFGFIIVGSIAYYMNGDDPNDKLLDNNVYFKGTLISMNASNNHLFGIVEVIIDSSNVTNFSLLNDDFIFPYRIDEGIAEIYCTIPIHSGLIEGKTEVIVDSNNRILEYITDGDTIKGGLYVGSSTNVSFIEKHSIFKDIQEQED